MKIMKKYSTDLWKTTKAKIEDHVKTTNGILNGASDRTSDVKNSSIDRVVSLVTLSYDILDSNANPLTT